MSNLIDYFHDEPVDEGVFETEVEEDDIDDLFDDDDESNDDKDNRSHISLSSDDIDFDNIDQKPWVSADDEGRRVYEMMFSNVPTWPLNGSWSYTEEYQKRLDQQFQDYLVDFPISKWLMHQAEAESAHERLLERKRWRSLGIKIFGRAPDISVPECKTFASASMQPPVQLPVPIPGRGHEAALDHMTHQPQPAQQDASLDFARSTTRFSHAHDSAKLSQPVHQTMAFVQPQQQPLARQSTATYKLPSTGQPPQFQPRVSYVAPQNTQPRQADGIGMKQKKHERRSRAAFSLSVKTPPYAQRERPSARRRSAKSSLKSSRQTAEAGAFPWHRQLDFVNAKATAKWDEDIYDPDTLESMAATRARNEPIIIEMDAPQKEKQKRDHLARVAKKSITNDTNDDDEEDETDDDNEDTEKRGRRTRVGGGKNTSRTDPYHSGQFAFASRNDDLIASRLGKDAPDEVMEACGAGELTLAECALIKICWSPGKKGTTQDLQQAQFTIKDTLLTRQQLTNTPILTRRAAECIIDFCPDLLFRDMLLRITTEAGYNNKSIRDRFCLNGCYADKATFTKRIHAALGQKQSQAKAKGYGPGERDWYEENATDWRDYGWFFGVRISNRVAAKREIGDKRQIADLSDGSGSVEQNRSKNSKVIKTKHVPDTNIGMDGASDAIENGENQTLRSGDEDGGSALDTDLEMSD